MKVTIDTTDESFISIAQSLRDFLSKKLEDFFIEDNLTFNLEEKITRKRRNFTSDGYSQITKTFQYKNISLCWFDENEIVSRIEINISYPNVYFYINREKKRRKKIERSLENTTIIIEMYKFPSFSIMRYPHYYYKVIDRLQKNKGVEIKFCYTQENINVFIRKHHSINGDLSDLLYLFYKCNLIITEPTYTLMKELFTENVSNYGSYLDFIYEYFRDFYKKITLLIDTYVTIKDPEKLFDERAFNFAFTENHYGFNYFDYGMPKDKYLSGSITVNKYHMPRFIKSINENRKENFDLELNLNFRIELEYIVYCLWDAIQKDYKDWKGSFNPEHYNEIEPHNDSHCPACHESPCMCSDPF